MKLTKTIGAVTLTAALLAATTMSVFAYDPSLDPQNNNGGGRPGIGVDNPNGDGPTGKGVYGAHYDEEGNFITEEQAQQGAANGLSARYTQGGKVVKEAAIGRQAQGDLGALAFKNATPAGWTEAFAFNITLNKKADSTLKNGQLFLFVPWQYQKLGRTFAVLGLDKDGKVKTFNDIDSNFFSVTSNLNLEGYAFELIYTDN